MRGVAGDRADVEAVLQIAQDVLVDVDDGDFVRFFARRGGYAAVRPTWPAPEDEDFHIGSRLAY